MLALSWSWLLFMPTEHLSSGCICAAFYLFIRYESNECRARTFIVISSVEWKDSTELITINTTNYNCNYFFLIVLIIRGIGTSLCDFEDTVKPITPMCKLERGVGITNRKRLDKYFIKHLLHTQSHAKAVWRGRWLGFFSFYLG